MSAVARVDIRFVWSSFGDCLTDTKIFVHIGYGIVRIDSAYNPKALLQLGSAFAIFPLAAERLGYEWPKNQL